MSYSHRTCPTAWPWDNVLPYDMACAHRALCYGVMFGESKLENQGQSAKEITRVRGAIKPPAPSPQGWGFERGSQRWSWTKHGLNLLTDFCIGLRYLLSFGIYVHKRGQGSSVKMRQHCFTCKAAHAFRSKRGQFLVSKSGPRFRPEAQPAYDDWKIA